MSNEAKAAVITQTASLGLTPTNFTNKPLSLSLFDPSLGTLYSVSVSLDGTEQYSVLVNSFDPSTQSATLQGLTNIDLTIPSLASFPFLSVTPQSTQNLSIPPGSSQRFGPFTDTANSTTSLTSPDVTPFLGTGTLPAFLSGTGNSSFNSTSGNISYGISNQGGGTVILTYNYTPTTIVPEPLTILGAMTALGLGASWKRKLK